MHRVRGGFTLPNALLAIGIALAIAATAFGAIAQGASPVLVSITVFKDKYDTTGKQVRSDDPAFTTAPVAGYVIKRRGVAATDANVSGIPLNTMLASAYPSQSFTLYSLKGQSQDDAAYLPFPKDFAGTNPPPATVVTSDITNASGQVIYKAPVIVFPTKPSGNKYILDSTSVLQIPNTVAARLGSGSQLFPKIGETKTSSGGLRFAITNKNSLKGNYGINSLRYQWTLYELNADRSINQKKGILESATSSVFVPSKATSNTASYAAIVVVTRPDGSTGVASEQFSSHLPDNGKTPTKRPKTNPGNTNNNATPPLPSPFGGGNGPGSGPAPGTTGPLPNLTKPTTPVPPPTPVPTPATGATGATGTVVADSSGLSQALQGLHGTGVDRPVSGVVVATPPKPADNASNKAGGPGLALLAQPAPINVFLPVKDPDALWRFILAVLFASTVFGATREYRKP